MEDTEIDEGLYSRQLYVLGQEAMRQMADADVLISGLGGLGAEVAKNVILSGVKSVTLHDETLCRMTDLSSQFYLTESDVGKFRAEACLPQLAALNSHVTTRSLTSPLTGDLLRGFTVVVLTDQPMRDCLWVSEVAREEGFALVVAETRGLCGRVFCDFGADFTVVDANGEPPATAMVADVTRERAGVVTCPDDVMHGLEDGDWVTFKEVQGMVELNGCEPKRVQVIGPYTFSIGDTSGYSEYKNGGIVTQVKMPSVIHFKKLKDSLQEPTFLVTDYAKPERPAQLHLAYNILHDFMASRNELPKPMSDGHSVEFVELAKELCSGLGEKGTTLDAWLLEVFAKTSRGSLAPMTALIGGIVGQEVLKACTGKFSPIQQWLYLDAFECLPSSSLAEEDCEERESRYDGQQAVFGHLFQKQLGSLRYLVVGAGAIGCEIVKNLTMMGVGAGENGCVHVADMDTIERSNLNRQFLYRQEDIGKPKATTLARAVRAMNPAMNVVPYMDGLGPESEATFNDDFFEALDGIATALDNVPSRLYMDRCCVFYQKPMIESGTLGTKGNVQVIVPFLTESYSSSQDPPEKTIPICTLKNFPNAIEHTLQWARDTFEGLFCQAPTDAQQYLLDPTFCDRILKLQGSQPVEILQSIKQVLVDERPEDFADCVAWARRFWQHQFHNQIRQLLFNFPPDQLTSSGQPFWSGPKRCPTPLTFSTEDPLHLDFILAAANLRAQVYGLPQNRDPKAIVEILETISVPEFTPRSGVNIPLNESDNAVSFSSGMTESVQRLVAQLPSGKQLAALRVTPLVFEKDDDTNLQMEFIVATSNLRAANYGIELADRLKSKLIAGKIIPAIATTTSVVAGLACLEFYKLAQGHRELDRYKNGFVNLALPFVSLSEPLPPARLRYGEDDDADADAAGTEWTLWDRFEVSGELTLQQFVDHFLANHRLNVVLVSRGTTMLYSTFMAEEKRAGRLGLTVSRVVQTVSGRPIGTHVKALVLELGCEDEEGNDVEVPYVRYTLPR